MVTRCKFMLTLVTTILIFLGIISPFNTSTAVDPFLSSFITCSNDSNIQILFDTCMTTSIHDMSNRLKPNVDSACGEPGSTNYDCCICSNYSAVEVCFKQFCKDGMKLDPNMLSKKTEHCKTCYTQSGLKSDDMKILTADGDKPEQDIKTTKGENASSQKKQVRLKPSTGSQEKGDSGMDKDNDMNKKEGKKDSASGNPTTSISKGLILSATLALALTTEIFIY